jgi:plasmid maintenance system killer protein
LNFEKLHNYPKWDYSIRINDKRRIIFNINIDWELKVISIEELSNHYS